MDFAITGEQSAYLVVPQSDRAKKWCEENVGSYNDLGEGFGVETRYIEELTAGILEAGFEVMLNGNSLYIGDDGTVCVRSDIENLAPGIRSYLESLSDPSDGPGNGEP